MPELPDIEVFRRTLENTALNKPVQGTAVHDDRILEDGLTPSGLGRHLKSKSFTGAHRHGKILFLRQRGGTLVLRFGMTGSVEVCPKNEKLPKHTRADLQLSDGSRLAIISQRLLGSAGFTDDEPCFIEDADLGPDALNDDIPEKDFIDMLANSRATIKATLMDQSRMAGIGNVYADEILFHASIRPNHKSETLTQRQRESIYRKMRHVLTTAVDRIAVEREFPHSWLLPIRGNNAACPRCDGKIKSMKVSGRTTWYCPHCQNK